jgi:hypothetical protein
MLDAFNARLEARDPAKGHFRSYRLEAGTDLLGNWLVDITFGRIGARGHRIRHVVAGPVEAQKLVRHTLRRRSTAKKRIGTGYRFLELHDPNCWVSLEVM